jgi:hypothetical protein
LFQISYNIKQTLNNQKTMAKKQFKIGERAVGGIIAVEITGKVISIKALDYFSKREVSTGSAISTDRGAENKLDFYLNELTTSYYADKILNWIKSKTEFTNEGW